ncbi:3-deoxy-D-manno-octulosonate 8-phosphate phosphatase (KDO 8-P phosphatase) [Muriicola jejuensis]|uniref:HAD hydrolase family protein n=1 Tax=Muriicola jejuensis TaxID=504488 RepID=A0A6P0UI65_9FLAO|nr:HAD-IIIA family hydrolase [Muriicola jejuensis]NER11469.1 HAD hydrolase family protein [Muriicola jejuensis]SMP20610.1 3-deoxy-D-manno-octulosonate 8-phosphate phosphatase (KDO 8-P phosphatase) [Muriicola jejuensis]
MEKSYKTQLKNITTFIFDVDGVLTDGLVLVTSEGELLRKMNVQDGYSIKTAIQKGYRICIISGGTNEGVTKRLKGLGVEDVYLGTHNKAEILARYMDQHTIDPEEVLYMGDDIPDIPAMQKAGLPCAPQNATPEVKAISKYISHKKGGEGCVRDVIEQVLKVRGDWFQNFSAAND